MTRSGPSEWNQPINPCHIAFILLAEGLRELLLLRADENHHTGIQKDRSDKTDPGQRHQRDGGKDEGGRAGDASPSC